jgi:hypothetical protein
LYQRQNHPGTLTDGERAASEDGEKFMPVVAKLAG